MAKVRGDESGTVALLAWRCGKLPRVSHSSFDGETIECVDALDGSVGISLFLDEGLYGQRPTMLERKEAQLEGWDAMEGRPEYGVQIVAHTDAKCLTSRIHSVTLDQGMRKARKTDISDLKDRIERGLLEDVVHIAGPHNPLDALTKHASRTAKTMPRLKQLVQGHYEPIFCEIACACGTEIKFVPRCRFR